VALQPVCVALFAGQHAESTRIFREQTSKKTATSIWSICNVQDAELGLKLIQENELLRHTSAGSAPASASAPPAPRHALMKARDKWLAQEVGVYQLRPASVHGVRGGYSCRMQHSLSPLSVLLLSSSPLPCACGRQGKAIAHPAAARAAPSPPAIRAGRHTAHHGIAGRPGRTGDLSCRPVVSLEPSTSLRRSHRRTHTHT